MEQKSFYYQIKGKLGEPQAGFYGGSSNWSFPPIFSGKVEAADKKEAKIKIEEEYQKKFQIRDLAKDLDSNEFLLKIDEIKEGSHYSQLFELQKCKQCDNTFYV